MNLELSADRAGLILVDWQERLIKAMPPEIAQQAVQNALMLVEAARRMRLPVLLSEQYPKGLGHTVPELASAVESLPGLVRFEKLRFGCPGVDIFDRALEKADRSQWIVAGMETHVCVYQTARALVAKKTVFVPQDAALSRTKANWRIGLDLMRQAGCVVTSTETVVFDLLKQAGTDDFKALSRLIK